MTQVGKGGLSKRLVSILASLRRTASELAGAVRERNPSRALALLREGSPLESAVSDILYVVFVVLLLAPVVLVPAYYLILTVA